MPPPWFRHRRAQLLPCILLVQSESPKSMTTELLPGFDLAFLFAAATPAVGGSGGSAGAGLLPEDAADGSESNAPGCCNASSSRSRRSKQPEMSTCTLWRVCRISLIESAASVVAKLPAPRGLPEWLAERTGGLGMSEGCEVTPPQWRSSTAMMIDLALAQQASFSFDAVLRLPSISARVTLCSSACSAL